MTVRYSRQAESTTMLFGSERLTDELVESLPTTGIFRILICRITHSLGNTLLLTPLIRELEAAYPGAEIDIVTRAEAAGAIFGAFASVRNIFRLPARAFANPLRFLSVVRDMRRTRYDLVIDPCPRSQTGRWLLLLAHGRFKLGFLAAGKPGVLTHGVPVPAVPKHTAQRPVFLLHNALGHRESRPYPPLDIALSIDERNQGEVILKRLLASSLSTRGSKGVIGIFANATGPKLLPEQWWGKFVDAFAERHVDYSIIEIIPMFGRSLLGSRFPTYYSSDIRRLAGMLSSLSLFISADCGILHLACASGTPVVGMFSVTDPAEWGPYGDRDRVLHVQGLPPERAAELIGEPLPD